MESLIDLVSAIGVFILGVLLGGYLKSPIEAVKNKKEHDVIRIASRLGKNILLVKDRIRYVPVLEYLSKIHDKNKREIEFALIKKLAGCE